jgi:hypothetical protein
MRRKIVTTSKHMLKPSEAKITHRYLKYLGYGFVAPFCNQGNERSVFIKCWEFLD